MNGAVILAARERSVYKAIGIGGTPAERELKSSNKRASPRRVSAGRKEALMKIRLATLLACFTAVGMISALSATARAQNFKVCKSTYALCTIARCDPIPGNDKQVACRCTVNRGYSAGQQACARAKETPNGTQIRSRYYPVHSYAVCSNDRPWAWCLDKPCLVDRNNPQAASCTCDLVKNLGDYVIVTSDYTANTCTTGVISSATVKQITQVTDYLKTSSKTLTPFDIDVLKK
jgi:hypothetical protein